MLGNKKSSFNGGGTTLVATDTTVVGNIHFSGCLDIEGVVQGDIIAREGQEGLVRIIDRGQVEGEIRAPSVVVNGTVEGDVYAAEHLGLAAKARVNGDVYYKLVEMAAGAEVNGALRHQDFSGGDLRQPDPAVEVTEVAPLEEIEELPKASGEANS